MSDISSDTFSVKRAFKKAGFPGKAALLLSTWFWVGLFPVAPGTAGSLAGLPLVLAMQGMGLPGGALLLFGVILVALWASGMGEKLLGERDPSMIVIDEVAGLMASLFLIPSSWLSLSVGVILFRCFDILKPFPIKWFEGVGGGAGVVLDDLMAGIYANMGTRLFLFLIPSLG